MLTFLGNYRILNILKLHLIKNKLNFIIHKKFLSELIKTQDFLSTDVTYKTNNNNKTTESVTNTNTNLNQTSNDDDNIFKKYLHLSLPYLKEVIVNNNTNNNANNNNKTRQKIKVLSQIFIMMISKLMR